MSLVNAITLSGYTTLIPQVSIYNGKPKYYIADLDGGGEDVTVEHDGTDWTIESVALAISQSVTSTAPYPPKTIGTSTIEYGSDGCFFLADTGSPTAKYYADYAAHEPYTEAMAHQFKKDGANDFCHVNEAILRESTYIETPADRDKSDKWRTKYTDECGEQPPAFVVHLGEQVTYLGEDVTYG